MSSDIVDVGLAVDSRQVDKGANALGKFGKQARKTETATDKMNKSLKASAIAMGAMATASAAALVLIERKMLSVSAEFENFQVRLQHTLGSVEEGNRLFQDMTKFAGEVPFAFNDIMDAATNLSGVMTGGVDDVNKWMPMIADLAAVSGLSIQDTTGQVVRMYSAGAGAADLFRERGITAMLGFQAGVTVSAEETRKKLIEAYQDPASKFAGAANDLAKTWDGSMSMMGDKWTLFVKQIGDKGSFNASKGVLSIFLEEISKSGDSIDGLSSAISDTLINSMQVAIFATSQLSKGLVGLTIIDDILRLGIDKTSGVIVDAFKAELEGISGLLMMIRDVTGKDLGVDAVEETLASMDMLSKGINETKKESVIALDSAVLSADESLRKIEELTVKLFAATETARNATTANVGKTAASGSGGGDVVTPELTAKEIAAQAEIEIARNKYILLGELALLSDSQKEERYLKQLEIDLLRMEEERQRLIDNKVWTDDLQAVFDDLEIQRAQETADKIGAINDDRIAKETASAVAAAKFKGAIDKGQYGDAITQATGFLKNSGMLNKKQFEQVKKVETAVAIVNGISTVMSAIKHGSQKGGVYGAVIEGAIAATMVLGQISKIQSATYGGGGSTSAPSGGSVPSASAPSAPSQAAPAQQVASSQPINFHMNIQTLDTASITPDTMQTMVDGFAPAIADAFGRGVHQAPLGA